MMMVPQEELPILEAFVNIKHRLTALKKDTTSFIRAKDVLQLYHAVAKEVTKLNAIRDRRDHAGLSGGAAAATVGSATTVPVGNGGRSRSASASGTSSPALREDKGKGKVYPSNTNNDIEEETSETPAVSTPPCSVDPDDASPATSSNVSPSTSARSLPSTPGAEEEFARVNATLPPPRKASDKELEEGVQDLSLHLTTTITEHSQRQPLSVSVEHLTPPSEDFSTMNMMTPRPPFRSTSPSPSPQRTPSAAKGAREADDFARHEEEEEEEGLTPSVAELSTKEIAPPKESNRVDMVLNDVFSLLSLFFLTIGKVKESPGTYCQIASMRQLLDHLNESGIYTQQDLQAFASRLQVLKTIIKRDREEGKHPDAIVKLMMRKLEDTERMLQTLLKSLSVLSVELVPIHQRLVSIRRQLSALATQPKPSKNDIRPIVEELRKIDSSRVDGKFLGPGGSSVPTGQAILVGLLEECFEICQDIRAREGEESVSAPLKPIFERLTEMRAKLERLQLTHRWTLRETDLYNYAQALREIENMRVDGVFVDAEGNKAEGQYVLLYLLRRCHGLIYRLIAESEPISEELMPIANKLSTVKKCLNEVLKYGGPFSARDLYPYHLALHQIDSLRKDGKFLSEDGSIPEGQAILVAQLSEAHEILEMLKESMGDDDEVDSEEEEEEEEDDEEETVEEDKVSAAGE